MLLNLIIFGLIATSSVLCRSVERIVNGELVDITTIPYQAALRQRTTTGWKHSCGAVVISTSSVLTAAHCLTSFKNSPSQLQVAVGTSKRTGGQIYDIIEVYPHEDYSSATVDNDVGLVAVAKKIVFSDSVRPVNVAHYLLRIPEGSFALVSGFGRTQYGGETSPDLRAAVVTIIGEEECKAAYHDIGVITSGMICASGANPPRDACQGDSGGPLVFANTVIGIVSWGEGCANTTYPGVYAKVSQYYFWIRNKMDEIENLDGIN